MNIGQQSTLNDIKALNEALSAFGLTVSALQERVDSTVSELGNATFEAGNFTPNLISSGAVYTPPNGWRAQEGRYSKIGNVVNYYIDLIMENVDPADETTLPANIEITLPFTSTKAYSVPTFRDCSGLIIPDGSQLSGYVVENSNRVRFQSANLASEITGQADFKVASSRRINISGFYFI